MKKILTSIFTIAQSISLTAQSESADSIPTRDLGEVVVEAQLQRTSAKVSTYLPTSKQKNAAQNGIDLLNRMSIPQLRLSPGNESSVLTVAGQEVDIFIDYLPASSQDLSGMRINDVRKVEYLDFPTDPRFKGKPHVVNFIMQKYEYGGYVKGATDNFLIANSYNLNIFTKIQYRRMTYDIAAGGYYSSNSHSYSNGTELFRLPQADGGIGEIQRRSVTEDASFRRKYFWPTFKALYRSEKITLRNTIGTNFDYYPAKNLSGLVSYSTSDFSPETFSTTESSRNSSISYDGDWNFILSSASSLNVSTAYVYSHTRQSSLYREEGADYINDATDNTHKAGLQIGYLHNFGKAGALKVSVPFMAIRNNTRYSGTNNAHNITDIYRMNASAGYNYANRRWNCQIDLGFTWDYSRTGDIKESKSSPTAQLSVQYSPDDRHSLSLWAHYFITNVPGSYRSTAVIEGSPLMSYTGNPSLTSQKSTSASAEYTWLPSNTFNLSVYGNFWTVGNRYAYLYRPAREGIVRTIAQPVGAYTNASAGIYGLVRLLGNRLQLVTQLSYNHIHDGYPYGWDRSSFNAAFQATYYQGNWNFRAYYVSPAKESNSSLGGIWSETADTYGIQAGWGNTAWSVSAIFCNFARWNWKNHTNKLESQWYDSTTDMYSINGHAFVKIAATYTIGFGKKIRRGDEATQKTGTSSGILQ